MKSVENKTTDINYTETPDSPVRKATYIDLLNIVLTAPKQGGFDWPHMEAWLAFDKIKKENPTTMEFEDAPFAYIKRLVENTKWSFVHVDLVPFKEYILSIK